MVAETIFVTCSENSYQHDAPDFGLMLWTCLQYRMGHVEKKVMYLVTMKKLHLHVNMRHSIHVKIKQDKMYDCTKKNEFYLHSFECVIFLNK